MVENGEFNRVIQHEGGFQLGDMSCEIGSSLEGDIKRFAKIHGYNKYLICTYYVSGFQIMMSSRTIGEMEVGKPAKDSTLGRKSNTKKVIYSH